MLVTHGSRDCRYLFAVHDFDSRSHAVALKDRVNLICKLLTLSGPGSLVDDDAYLLHWVLAYRIKMPGYSWALQAGVITKIKTKELNDDRRHSALNLLAAI